MFEPNGEDYVGIILSLILFLVQSSYSIAEHVFEALIEQKNAHTIYEILISACVPSHSVYTLKGRK